MKISCNPSGAIRKHHFNISQGNRNRKGNRVSQTTDDEIKKCIDIQAAKKQKNYYPTNVIAGEERQSLPDT